MTEWEVHFAFVPEAYGEGWFDASEEDECVFVNALTRDGAIEQAKEEVDHEVDCVVAAYELTEEDDS